MSVISTIGYDQHRMIADIISLYVPAGEFDLDPTYSKGQFYNSPLLKQPLRKRDLYPQTPDTVQGNAANLEEIEDNSLHSIMFDPPFLAGYTTAKPTGLIGERFHGFPYIKDLWKWYDECLVEFYRTLSPNGVLVFKCQDTVSSAKQHLSHVHIINEAAKNGFYCKDLFILLANNRMIGHNHKIQQHARKFHSYFIVFVKKGSAHTI